jgi:hypothetical protein
MLLLIDIVGICQGRDNATQVIRDGFPIGQPPGYVDRFLRGARAYMEVEMVDGQSSPRIELEAARLAIEWKNLFAIELKLAAQQLAKGSDLVTANHYRQALPDAVSKVLHAAKTKMVESQNDQRRVA